MARKQADVQNSLEEEIKSYGDKIVAIDDQVQAVRQIADVYIGALGNPAFLTMTREIIQNSFDEDMKGFSSNREVYVWFDERDLRVTVQDSGRGIPEGKIDTVFGQLHSSSNYNKKPGEYSAGKNGQGGSLVNMLSHTFTVDTFVLGEGRHAEFIEGHMWKKGEVKIPKSQGKQGTIISFVPNQDVIGHLEITWMDVYKLIEVIMPTTRLGLTVHMEFTDSKGKVHVETLTNTDGIMHHLYNMTQSPIIKPILMSDDTGYYKAEIALTWDSTMTSTDEEIVGLCNTCPTIGGSHIEGLLKGICDFFRKYMNTIFLAGQKSKKPLTVINADIKAGLKASISAFCLKASYTGQSKEVLYVPEMVPFVAQLVAKELDNWAKTNPNDLKKLCQYFKDVAEIRSKSDEGREKLSTKYATSVIGGLPKKFVKPNGKEHLELFIVEGDSALGPARTGRNPECQGIFPIRGKLPNAITTPRDKFLQNEEVSAILTILGAGYGRSFDIEKCKYEKVVAMCDADPDGNHIRSLLLRFFLIYCEPLVVAGRVYGAVPPLYSMTVGKKNTYFTDMKDYTDYIQKEFMKNNTIADPKTKQPYSYAALSKILRANLYYIETLGSIAQTYAIDPVLLELVLINRDLPFAKFKAFFEKAYRFVTVQKKDGMTILSGIVNGMMTNVFLDQRLLNACATLIAMLSECPTQYLLNGQVVTLYGLMYTFENTKPEHIDRNKGLGEMDPDQLAESTLRPGMNRTLIRYTVENIKKEIEQIRYIDSNRSTLLKDVKVTKEDVLG
ncbi:MAG: ATP-binding protein [Pseudobutyrivibrio sp.]|nr:ATP-binding protein [Pseudobutyrivibrio sp.]